MGEEEEGKGRVRRRLEQFGELIGIVSGLFNEASSDTLMIMDVMATSRVNEVARETDLTSSQQEVEKDSRGNWTRTYRPGPSAPLAPLVGTQSHPGIAVAGISGHR